MPRYPPASLLIAAAVLAGCGAGGSPRATHAGQQRAAARPVLATTPPATGEIVLGGEASPATQGPYEFNGRYLVRFEQVEPEHPQIDFAGQTPFTAALTPRDGDPRGAVPLFAQARRTGERQLAIHGRYYVEVSFGDFPYAVRFTPLH